jgi:hypothetical protein
MPFTTSQHHDGIKMMDGRDMIQYANTIVWVSTRYLTNGDLRRRIPTMK